MAKYKFMSLAYVFSPSPYTTEVSILWRSEYNTVWVLLYSEINMSSQCEDVSKKVDLILMPI